MAPTRKVAELFYELRAKTEGLDKDVAGAQRSFGKLTDYIIKNPVVAIGAVGTALAGIAVQATRMALEVDRGMRRVQQVTAGGTEGIKALREEVRRLSEETGRSQAELAQAAAEAAKSASNTAEVGVRLRAALSLSQAAGLELAGTINSLDTVLDAFGLTTADSERALATLFATAQGKQPVEDLFRAIEQAATPIQRLGLDLDTASRALVALGEKGLNAGQAAAELQKLAKFGAAGRTEVERLAAEIPPAADAMGKLREATDLANNSAEALNERLRNRLRNTLIEIGNDLIPRVERVLRRFIDTMDILSGKVAPIEAQGALATVISIGPLIERLQEQGQKGAKGLRDLQIATQDLFNAVRKGDLVLKDLPVDQLERLRTALQAILASDRIGQAGKSFLADLLVPIDNLIAKAPQAAAAVQQVQQAAGTGTGTGTGLGSDRLRDAQAAAKALADESANAAEDALERVNRAVAEARDAYNEQAGDAAATVSRILALEAGAARQLAELTGNTAQALRIQITETVEELRALGASDEQIRSVVAPLEAALKAATAFNGALAKIEIPDAVRQKLFTPIQRVEQELDKLQKKLKTAGASDEEIQRALGQKAIEQLTKAYQEAGFAAEDARRKAEDYAQGLTQVESSAAAIVQRTFEFAQAILSVAGALGDVSTETQNIARGAINIGAGIARAFKDPAGGGLQIVSGLGDLIQGLSGSAERREQREQHKENLATLRRIEKHTGDLVGISQSGSEIAGITSGVEQFLTATGTAGGHREFENIDKFFEALGIDWAEVNALAEAMGITLNSTKQSYLDFHEALTKADLFAFANTFRGQLSRFNLEMQLFGDAFDEPFERFSGFVDVLNDPETGAPGLFGALDGLDIASTEGRQAARDWVAEMFRMAKEGELTAEQLGGLSLQEFLEALGFLDVQLDAAEAGVLSLAETLAQQFSDIALDAAIFGRSTEDTVNRQLQALGISGINPETGAGTFDLTSAAGRQAALEALRELARTTEDRDLKQLIASTIRSLESLPELPGEIAEELAAAGGGGGGGGATSRFASAGLQTLTIFQGDRLITLGESQLVVQRQIAGLIAGATATRGMLVQPPPLSAIAPATASAVVASGGVSVVFNVTVSGSVADARTVGEQIGQAAVNRFLADEMLRERFRTGNTQVI